MMNNSKFHQWPLLVFLIIFMSIIDIGNAQNPGENLSDLPLVNGVYIEGVQQDYLVEKFSEEADAFRNEVTLLGLEP